MTPFEILCTISSFCFGVLGGILIKDFNDPCHDDDMDDEPVYFGGGLTGKAQR